MHSFDNKIRKYVKHIEHVMILEIYCRILNTKYFVSNEFYRYQSNINILCSLILRMKYSRPSKREWIEFRFSEIHVRER